MHVRTYGAIPRTTETEPETDTDTETENGNGNGTFNIRNFGLSTRIRLFVRVILSVCLTVYFLDVWRFLYLPTLKVNHTVKQKNQESYPDSEIKILVLKIPCSRMVLPLDWLDTMMLWLSSRETNNLTKTFPLPYCNQEPLETKTVLQWLLLQFLGMVCLCSFSNILK